jgi:hypothetical protein
MSASVKVPGRTKVCPDCKEEINADAARCPHCRRGFPQYGVMRRDKPYPVGRIALGALIALALLGYLADGPQTDRTAGRYRSTTSAVSEPTGAATGCRYEYGAVSADHVTASGEHVVFRLYDCGGWVKKEYVDLTGRPVRESDLIRDPRQQEHDTLEDATGMDLDRPEAGRARRRGASARADRMIDGMGSGPCKAT